MKYIPIVLGILLPVAGIAGEWRGNIALENRYFVQALEETSKEILEDMKQQGLSADSVETLAEILQLSDLVKFAKHQPGQEENFNIVDRAIDFVNQTKLIYKPEPAQPETAVEKLENNVIE